MRAPAPDKDQSLRRVLTCVALLWLAGNALRLTILAVPPVIPLIHAELRMSETEVGILSGLPPVLFALAAVPGSLLIARFGALSTLIVGLLATAAGSALRGAVPDTPIVDIGLLYAATIVTSFGVAVMQPSLAPLVREWLPHRIGFGTAVYTNGLIVGEIFPVALTLPVVLPLVGGSWRLGFVVWGIPVAIIALVIVALAPKQTAAKHHSATAPGRRWWPDWRDGLLWRLGIMLGSVNAMYFSTNAFIPDYLHHIGRADLISSALTALNIGQIPASLLLLALASRLERKIWPYMVSGVLCALSVLGLMFGSGTVIIACSAALGFSASSILIIILALPPLLSPPDDVHRMSAGMFTISYSYAVIVPIVSGLAWDITGIPAVAFAPIGLSALMLLVLPQTMDFARRSPTPP
jgi:MFS transporter, CP family, cyanate transporter